MTSHNLLSVRALLFQFFLYVLLTGCTKSVTQPLAADHLQAPYDFPEAYYEQARLHDSKILKVDSRHSLLAIIVHRGGPLARLGHDHVVASHDITGYVDLTAGRADLYVPLDTLTVDETGLRAKAGFTTQPDQSAIDGTRQNMLVKVLQTNRYPRALISVRRSATDSAKLTVTITLQDSVKIFEVASKTRNTKDGFEIEGQMSFNQTDFGITPFSILGGALQVQDRLDLHFNIVATEY